jgi:hypothetical protein
MSVCAVVLGGPEILIILYNVRTEEISSTADTLVPVRARENKYCIFLHNNNGSIGGVKSFFFTDSSKIMLQECRT